MHALKAIIIIKFIASLIKESNAGEVAVRDRVFSFDLLKYSFFDLFDSVIIQVNLKIEEGLETTIGTQFNLNCHE